MSAENNDLDEPQLSAETLKALKEFYEEQNEKILNLYGDKKNISDIKFDEDWQLSQFWYDENTCEQLVKCAVQTIGCHGTVALISCPTLYKHFKNNSPSISVKLFEYDKRFSAYGIDYEFYDYNEPLKLNNELFNYFDLVIVDPPFLSEECLTKSILTATNLTKNKLILCTGEVMEGTAKKLINLHKCSFIPKHKNNLGNEFACFTNFLSPLD
ncbi:EEF1A lysine methyltransferase 1 [Daktulosphaira vitifoliae]|uniref:EEF1A lysine methyltransferase 1 n=1 Tax=Daktulosphaira vitifoliae TaxID=58002 RepID=UPI0021AA9F36|nr:EEF1A lysine methyltransferase 1 [Daktulosphaira vitifoliae]